MKKIALILAVSLLFVVSAWGEGLDYFAPRVEMDLSKIIVKPYPVLVIIKIEQKSRRHMTDCNSCSEFVCTAMMCPIATFKYNEYSIGTSDGKILFTIEDTEKVEE